MILTLTEGIKYLSMRSSAFRNFWMSCTPSWSRDLIFNLFCAALLPENFGTGLPISSEEGLYIGQCTPLTIDELSTDFNLQWVLSYGSLPKIYSSLKQNKTDEARDLLRAYAIIYLREEIKAEALVRNLQGFQKFLDVAVAQYSEQVNFSAVSRDCQVALSTVKEYYSILEDTLIGFFLYPYLKSERKRMSRQPKFYFFDNGVTRALLGSLQDHPPRWNKGGSSSNG